MHSFIHPLSEAVPPVWEAKTDWQIFQIIAQKVSELAKHHLPTPVTDIVNVPLQHDSADEITQTSIQDWSKGECEPIPGKTMHKIVTVERDYTKIYEKYISLGGNMNTKTLGAHGNSYMADDVYAEMIEDKRQAEIVVNTIFDCIRDSLRNGNKTEIRGFGSFRLRARRMKEGRNPKTGATVAVPAKRVPFFKAGKELKELLNK